MHTKRSFDYRPNAVEKIEIEREFKPRLAARSKKTGRFVKTSAGKFNPDKVRVDTIGKLKSDV